MKIKLFVMDVDGTMTDGKIYMGNNGELFKAFNIKDGYGIHEILPKHGVKTAILTGRCSAIVENRAKELEINDVIQNAKNKIVSLKKLVGKYGISFAEVAYIGDDIIDLAPMELCGVKGCPADAAKEIKNKADYICLTEGGAGAVREFIDWLVEKNMLEMTNEN